MRLRLALAITAIPIAIGSYLVACSSEPSIENLCGWIGDESNCYRKFASDIGTRCGAERPADMAADQSPRPGTFGNDRTKLELCKLDGADGGQVKFDPPLDISQFPLTSASFVFLTKLGAVCGAGAVGGDGAMALSIEPVSLASGFEVPLDDGGVAEAGEACADNTDPICGGSFSASPVTERELIDTKCPSGESHHFNRLQLAKCSSAPSDYDQLMPRAELESSAGGIGVDGYVAFRVYFPPTTGALSGAEPTVIEYFRCTIPSAPATCANGMKDDDELGVDCGTTCGVGCADGTPCLVDTDCLHLNCKLAGGAQLCAKSETCADNTKNPGEGDIDCGVVCDKPCALGDTCITNADCSTMLCEGTAQQPKTCKDPNAPDAGPDASGAGGAGGAGGGDGG